MLELTWEKLYDIFAEKGYKGISVREICRNVNLADGIIYHYFPRGKKELFREVVETNVRRIMFEIDEKNSLDRFITIPFEVALEHYYDSFMEVIDMDFEVAAITVKDAIIKYAISKVFGFTRSEKNIEEIKKRVIAY